jgi:KRAB domain-containing zinc finger protein
MFCPYLKKTLQHEELEADFFILIPDFKVLTVSKFLEMAYTGKTVLRSSKELLELKEFGSKLLGFKMLLNWNIEIEEQPLEEELSCQHTNDISSSSSVETISSTIRNLHSSSETASTQRGTVLSSVPLNLNKTRDALTDTPVTGLQDSHTNLYHTNQTVLFPSNLNILKVTNQGTQEANITSQKSFVSGSNSEVAGPNSRSQLISSDLSQEFLTENDSDSNSTALNVIVGNDFSEHLPKTPNFKIDKINFRNAIPNTDFDSSNFLKHSVQKENQPNTSLLSNESIISKQTQLARHSQLFKTSLNLNPGQKHSLRSPKLNHPRLTVPCKEKLITPDKSSNCKSPLMDEQSSRKRSQNRKYSEPLKKKTSPVNTEKEENLLLPTKDNSDLDCSNDSLSTNFDATEHFSIQSLVDKHKSMLSASELLQQPHLTSEKKHREEYIAGSILHINETSKYPSASTITSNDSILRLFSPLRGRSSTKIDLNETGSFSNESFIVRQPSQANPHPIFNQNKPMVDNFFESKDSSFEINNTKESSKIICQESKLSFTPKIVTTQRNNFSGECSSSTEKKLTWTHDTDQKYKLNDSINILVGTVKKPRSSKKKLNLSRKLGKNNEKHSDANQNPGRHTEKLRQKNFACPKCNKKFETNYKLKLHDDVIHLKLKLHECQICGKRFGLVYNLKAHTLQIHNGVKPVQTTRRIFVKKFDCNQCSERFISSKRLNAHTQTVHLKLKPHQCPQCEAAFGFIHNLKYHFKSVHQREKKYQCKMCTAKFSHGGHLNRHVQAVHDRAKTYKCKMCGIKFDLQRNLDKHIESVHPKDWTEKVPKTFDCAICNLKYHQKINLDKHMKAVHVEHKQIFETPNSKTTKQSTRAYVTSTPMSSYAGKNLDNTFDVTFESL